MPRRYLRSLSTRSPFPLRQPTTRSPFVNWAEQEFVNFHDAFSRTVWLVTHETTRQNDSIEHPYEQRRHDTMTTGVESKIRVEVRRSPDEACLAAAQTIADALRSAVADRGVATLAVSGGKTPATMLAALTRQAVPWSSVQVFQVDERCAPIGHLDRNSAALTHTLSLVADGPSQGNLLHLMDVPDDAVQGWERLGESAAQHYSTLLPPAGFDVVHLGLGDDGHTASLVPNDPVLAITDRAVAVTETYQGRHRLTLTTPTINSARLLVWLAVGAAKMPMISRLLQGDTSIPAGRFADRPGVLFTDYVVRPT